MSGIYWDNEGKYQALHQQLRGLIPNSGSIENPLQNKALEKFRKACNCYYDLYNNGLYNRAAEFRRVFGFDGKSLAKSDEFIFPLLEQKIDEIILAAAKEQNLLK